MPSPAGCRVDTSAHIATCHRRSIRYTRGGMKLTSIFATAAAGLLLCSVSCERHEWEETKALHEKHGHGASHSDDTHATGDHAEEKTH